MAKLTFEISMSLDGFVAGPNPQATRTFPWPAARAPVDSTSKPSSSTS